MCAGIRRCIAQVTRTGNVTNFAVLVVMHSIHLASDVDTRVNHFYYQNLHKRVDTAKYIN